MCEHQCSDRWRKSRKLWNSASWQYPGELCRCEQWTREDREYEQYSADRCRAGDLQHQGNTDQLLRDDGAARQSVGQHVLAALVQQCRPGYPTALRECKQCNRHSESLHWRTANDQRLPREWIAFEQSLYPAGGSQPAGELYWREQWSGANCQQPKYRSRRAGDLQSQ